MILAVEAVGVPVRQNTALAAIAGHLAAAREVLGALVVESMAGGTADAASDIDLIETPLGRGHRAPALRSGPEGLLYSHQHCSDGTIHG
jgi:hypothetical protein